MNPAEADLAWVRDVAKAKWADRHLSELPWWVQAASDYEIADPQRHTRKRDRSTAVHWPETGFDSSAASSWFDWKR